MLLSTGSMPLAPQARANRNHPPAAAQAARHSRGRVRARATCQQHSTDEHVSVSRRQACAAGLAGAAAALAAALPAGTARAEEGAQIQITQDEAGSGQHAVRQGDLVLVHYTGTLADGSVFDSTRGGLKYRDGGDGVFRPAAFRLSGAPQPGICLGLQAAVEGMRIGGRRSVVVPPQLGFGDAAVLAPYAAVPAGSVLRYDVELLRVSSVGPDMLMKGISRCSAGGASASAENCANITLAEYF